MTQADPPCTYFELTGDEFATMLAGQRPELVSDWKEIQARPQGHLRAIRSGLLPWEHKGATIDVIAWQDGSMMVSPRVWTALGGTDS